MEVNGQLQAPVALPAVKEPPVLIGHKDQWAPGRCEVQENLFPPPGIEPSHPARRPSVY
jgi:hypothetical protein